MADQHDRMDLYSILRMALSPGSAIQIMQRHGYQRSGEWLERTTVTGQERLTSRHVAALWAVLHHVHSRTADALESR